MAQSFPVPFSTYGSTRLDVDNQKRINIFPNSLGEGVRQFPGLLLFGVIATNSATYVSGESTSLSYIPQGVWVSADGLKMYSMKETTSDVTQHTLSVAFDLSSHTLNGTINTGGVSGGLAFSQGMGDIFIQSSGLVGWAIGKEYGGGGTDIRVVEITFSSAFDYSTATIGNTFDFLANTAGVGVAVNAAGTRMYILVNDTIREYTLSTANSITTIGASANATFDLDTQIGADSYYGLDISPDWDTFDYDH